MDYNGGKAANTDGRMPKVGDMVVIVAVPDPLPTGMGTRAVFDACVGHAFSVVGIANGLLELEVGNVVGEASYMHSIWIEPRFVRPA